MNSSFRSLKEVFEREKSLHALRELVDSSDVVVKFYQIFPNLEMVAVPLSSENKILKLKIENPAWRSELKFKEAEMIEKINQFFNEQRINQIKFIG
ncbi:MAG: DciA family protein [Ignavibacteriaceae bacterium]